MKVSSQVKSLKVRSLEQEIYIKSFLGQLEKEKNIKKSWLIYFISGGRLG